MDPLIVIERFKERFHNCNVRIWLTPYSFGDAFDYSITLGSATARGGFSVMPARDSETLDKILDIVTRNIAHRIADEYILGFKNV